jgi:hypothetical protein
VCNDFGDNIPYSDYLAAFSETRIPVRWPKAAPNLEPREDIWPTERAPVIRRLEDGTNEFRSCGGAFNLPGQRSLSSIFVPKVDGSRSVGVSGTGITFFRVYWHEIAKDEVEIHEGRRGLVLLRRFMASHGGGW